MIIPLSFRTEWVYFFVFNGNVLLAGATNRTFSRQTLDFGRLARSKNGNGKERETLCDCEKVGTGSKGCLAPVDGRVLIRLDFESVSKWKKAVVLFDEEVALGVQTLDSRFEADDISRSFVWDAWAVKSLVESRLD